MNCIIVDDEKMSQNAAEHLVSQAKFLNLIATCSSAMEGLNVVNNKKVDLILLDVEMPKMSGLDFIKSLKNPPLIILITSKKDYALESYEYNVVDYLLKPIVMDRFFKAVGRAKEIFESSQQSIDFSGKDYVFIKSNSTLVKLSTKEILFVEALGDYTIINTFDKKYTIHSTMKAIEAKLPADEFIRVHRSFIVSIDSINSIDDTVIVMDKKLIPIGAVYKENLTKG